MAMDESFIVGRPKWCDSGVPQDSSMQFMQETAKR